MHGARRSEQCTHAMTKLTCPKELAIFSLPLPWDSAAHGRCHCHPSSPKDQGIWHDSMFFSPHLLKPPSSPVPVPGSHCFPCTSTLAIPFLCPLKPVPALQSGSSLPWPVPNIRGLYLENHLIQISVKNTVNQKGSQALRDAAFDGSATNREELVTEDGMFWCGLPWDSEHRSPRRICTVSFMLQQLWLL